MRIILQLPGILPSIDIYLAVPQKITKQVSNLISKDYVANISKLSGKKSICVIGYYIYDMIYDMII